MILRPLQPTWLSLWLPKSAQATALEALALTQKFALEGQKHSLCSAEQQAQFTDMIQKYQNLKAQYQSLWPEPYFPSEATFDQVAQAWQHLAAWQEAAKTFYSELKQWESAWETCQRWQKLSHCCRTLTDLPLVYFQHQDEKNHDLGEGLAAGIWVLTAVQAAAVPWQLLEGLLWRQLHPEVSEKAAKNAQVMPLSYYFVIGKASAVAALARVPFGQAGAVVTAAEVAGNGDGKPAQNWFGKPSEKSDEKSAENLEKKTEKTKNYTESYDELWQLPADLPALASDSRKALTLGQALAAWQSALETQRNQLAYQEQALAEQHDLSKSLAIFERLQWVMDNAAYDSTSHYFVEITGWFHSPSVTDLSGKLAELLPNTPYLLTTPPPPSGIPMPVILHNPSWVQPFEWFVKAMGMPDKNHIDPSPLLALLVPLLFGYMFGDVGQGAVLAALGYAFRRKAMGRLLFLGGLSAMFFGLLYGEVFALEGVLPVLWLSPLHEPLPLLVVPLLFAMALLSLGLFFNVLQQWWARSADFWPSLGLWLLYSSLALSLAQSWCLWLAIPALFLILLGKGFGHLGAAVAELLENAVQLAMNTLSFIRVGAFALAHAGLASAVGSLASGAPWWLAAVIFVFGNILILLIEGLAVSIQTTRLVLFEFFVRFFKGTGRAFVALTLPHWAYRS